MRAFAAFLFVLIVLALLIYDWRPQIVVRHTNGQPTDTLTVQVRI